MNFKRIVRRGCMALVALGLALPANAQAKTKGNPQRKPNIVIYLMDDVGFGHLSAFGGPIQSPNVDRIANQGLRYTNFHTTALCSPTRGALMTGRNHHSIGMGKITELESTEPGYTGRIPFDKQSFVEVLRQNGYATSLFGKWHDTPVSDVTKNGPFERWPMGFGFEFFYGFMGGDTNQWEPTLWKNTEPIEPHVGNASYLLNPDLAAQASQWIADVKSKNPDKPFLLKLSTGPGHAPHHADKAYIEKYKGKFDSGWDKIREETFARQMKMGLFPSSMKLSERDNAIPTWDSLSADEKHVYARQMEVFAGMMEQTDADFGQVLAAIERAGEMDNTIVFITSDNGASAEGGMHGVLNEIQAFNGIHEDSTESFLKRLDELGGRTLFNHYHAGWAMAGNTPFRYYKQTVHEGGVRDPMILSWPAKIKETGIRNQFTHVIDFAPTMLELADVKPMSKINGVKQKPIEGVSFANSLANADAPTKKKIQYFEMFGNRGVWKDGWKAVTRHIGRHPWETDKPSNPDYDSDVWELYDLNSDPSETNNLAEKYPERVIEMKKLFEIEAKKYNVYPMNDTTAKGFYETVIRETKGKYKFTYTSNDYRLPNQKVPLISNATHVMTIRANIPATGAEGVLVTHGGRNAGYALYMKDQKLHYTYNYFGMESYQLDSDRVVPSGDVTIRYEYDKTEGTGGNNRLFINDQLVAKGVINKAVPFLFSAAETFDVGRDTGSPVTDDYAVPAFFTGQIQDLVITLPTVK